MNISKLPISLRIIDRLPYPAFTMILILHRYQITLEYSQAPKAAAPHLPQAAAAGLQADDRWQ
jgi:hypothetical protein